MPNRHAMDDRHAYVGQSVGRIDGVEKVTGRALYPGDLTRPGMLYMKLLFAGRAHARILRVDTERARALPGVIAVLTAADVPCNERGLAVLDQPVLCGDVVRFEGDQVAAVIADTAATAAAARELIDVTYADLPVVTDAREALRPDSPRIHAGQDSNILRRHRIRRGSVEQGLAQADVVVKGNYYVPMQEHAFLQPEAGLAYLDGDLVVVETAGQALDVDQVQIAHSLNLPLERVRVLYRTIGGAFGGREDISVQIILALAAMKTGRPVKTVWSREESIRGHCKRHQMYIAAEWGATHNGRLTAARVEIIADAGAYAYTSTMVVPQTALTCTGVYDIPNVSVDVYAVYTNNLPAGAMRGFGSPQGIFAAEMQMEKLAQALQLDPVTLRERNLLGEGALLSVGTPLPNGLKLGPVLTACAEALGYTHGADGWQPQSRAEEDPARLRGTGLAIGFKNVGFSMGYTDQATATVELRGGSHVEEAIVYFGGAEVGQGVSTVVQQIAAEALGVPLNTVRLVVADTHRTQLVGSASASRLTLMGGNAVMGAARAALDKWHHEERPASATYTYSAPPTTGFDPETGHCLPNVTWSLIAQAVEVEVDPGTGALTVPRVVSVVDAGKAVNPRGIEGQIEGGVLQGLGYAVMEDFVTRDGITLTPNLSSYLIPTMADVPAVSETVILEQAEPLGPWGARGLGEAPLLCIAPALVAAVHRATGAWFDRLPLTPPAVVAGLAAGSGTASIAMGGPPPQTPVTDFHTSAKNKETSA